MAQQITAKTTGILSGKTGQGTLTPVSLAFALTNQDAHTQQTVVVEPADVLKLVGFPSQQATTGKKQTMFLLQTDKDVQVRMNGVPQLTWSIPEGGVMMLSGLPEITQLEFTGLATVNATVFITKILGVQTLSDPPGGGVTVPAGGLRLENLGPSTIGQTAFVLPSTPTNPAAALLLIEGVGYSGPTYFTLAGNSLTWLDTAPPGALPAGARVEILYQ